MGGLSGMTDEEEAGSGSLSSPAPPLLPLLLVEDKSLWAGCRNTSPFRKDRQGKKTEQIYSVVFVIEILHCKYCKCSE